MGGGDEAVSVGWVAHDQHLDITMGIVVEGSALGNEDLGVLLEQVTSFHTLSSGLGPHEQGSLDILEA